MKSLTTIVTVDDHRSMRELVAGMLEEESRFKCIGSFPDAISALGRLPKLKPDIVLMDINMPGMKGIECIRRLKPKMTETSFVILTSYRGSDDVFDAFSAGAVGYLLKRSIADDLIPALQEVSRGGSPLNGEIARKIVQRLHEEEVRPIAKRDKLEKLSEREMDVLNLLARGRLYKEIAHELGISVNTANSYARRIYKKLHAHSRAEAVAIYNRVN